jgi:hypothetical protein
MNINSTINQKTLYQISPFYSGKDSLWTPKIKRFALWKRKELGGVWNCWCIIFFKKKLNFLVLNYFILWFGLFWFVNIKNKIKKYFKIKNTLPLNKKKTVNRQVTKLYSLIKDKSHALNFLNYPSLSIKHAHNLNSITRWNMSFH